MKQDSGFGIPGPSAEAGLGYGKCSHFCLSAGHLRSLQENIAPKGVSPGLSVGNTEKLPKDCQLWNGLKIKCGRHLPPARTLWGSGSQHNLKSSVSSLLPASPCHLLGPGSPSVDASLCWIAGHRRFLPALVLNASLHTVNNWLYRRQNQQKEQNQELLL